MCKNRLFASNLHYNCGGHASTIFTPCLDEIQGSKKHSGTWFHLTRLHSGEDKSLQLHIGRKRNGEFWEYFKTGHDYYGWPLDLSWTSWHSKIITRQFLTWLSFVTIHMFLLSLPMLTCPQEEKVGLLNLEVSTRNILNMHSWRMWPT